MDPKDDEPLDGKSLTVFLPEGIVAALMVITAPIWTFVMAVKGHVLAGIVWWIGAWALGYFAYWSYRKGDRGGLFLAIMGTLCLAGVISKWAGQH